MSLLAYRTGSHDDILLSGQRLYQHSITNSAKHSSKTYRRARQRCFRLLTFLSLLQVIVWNSAVSLYGTFYWSALHCWWWSADIASDPTWGSRHDFPSGRPGRTLLFSYWFSPWPRKEFDWNGDVATRVDMRTTKVKFFKKYLCERMSDPGTIIRPGRWKFLTWERLRKTNCLKQRCLVLRYDLLECFAMLVMKYWCSLWPDMRKSSWLPVR